MLTKQAGTIPKREYTLANAIAAGGQLPVYEALCQTYVEQDKLLDAVSMLDQVADPAIKAQLDAQRPAVPTSSVEPGFYSQYMNVTLSGQGSLYVSIGDGFPSTASPLSGSHSPGAGRNLHSGCGRGENGLVSPWPFLAIPFPAWWSRWS